MTPSPNGSNGERDEQGRFRKGNSGGPGNPQAQQVGRLRAALIRALTPEDAEAIVRALIEKAKDGDVQAARELLNRTVGRPLEPDVLDRLEALEAAVMKE